MLCQFQTEAIKQIFWQEGNVYCCSCCNPVTPVVTGLQQESQRTINYFKLRSDQVPRESHTDLLLCRARTCWTVKVTTAQIAKAEV